MFKRVKKKVKNQTFRRYVIFRVNNTTISGKANNNTTDRVLNNNTMILPPNGFSFFFLFDLLGHFQTE